MVANAATSNSVTKFEIPWHSRNIKYQYGSVSPIYFEELTEPWDLWVESAYMGTMLGGPFHQVLVKNGLERIFSIRTRDRIPLCDVITMPENARKLSAYWCNRRILRTSNPMTVDGQRLIVLDAVMKGERRASMPFIEVIEKFFTSKGGMLGEEHPNELTISDKKDIEIWNKIVTGHLLENLLISSTEIVQEEWLKWAMSLEEAIVLLRTKNWWKVYINGDDDWADKVLDHMKNHKVDRPRESLDIIGGGENTKRLERKAKEVMK